MTDLKRLLGLLAVLEAAKEDLDLERLAEEAGYDGDALVAALESLSERGFCHVLEVGRVPSVTRAGRQALEGVDVPEDAVRFLPKHVDDLRAREALLDATGDVLQEFAEALAGGVGIDYAREILPEAFVPAVDALLAARLFAAMAAVAARLSSETPAACVAEELMAVAFIAEATTALEDAVIDERLSAADFRSARDAMQGVFELFGDDDVLAMFEMSEPADAAVSGHDPIAMQLGVVDQRVEAWFYGFGGTLPAGHVVLMPPDDE